LKSLYEAVSNIEKQEKRFKDISKDKELYTEDDYNTLMYLLENNRKVRDPKLKNLYDKLLEGGLI